MAKRISLGGDAAATIAKANFLLNTARKEVAGLKTDTAPADRAKLRQAANKGWYALSAGADAQLMATTGKTAKGQKKVLGVYKNVGSDVGGDASTAYDHLHVSCGYEDRKSCTRESVKSAFRLAGQALSALERSMSKRRKR